MMRFDELTYLPSLRTRRAELDGYGELADELKDQVMPLFVLGNLHRIKEPGGIVERVREKTSGRPFFLDITHERAHAFDSWQELRDSTNGYERWRRFSLQFQEAIPVAQMNGMSSLRDVIRQAILLQDQTFQIAIRSMDPPGDVETMKAILAAVERVDDTIFILDFGYIREDVRGTAVTAARVINALRAVDASVNIVCMASSFPRSVTPYGDHDGALDIRERDLHDLLGGHDVTIYGDHGSIHAVTYESGRMRWVPRIDYPLERVWIYRRVREDQGGLTRCARQILELSEWQPELAEQWWGARKIADAASGDIEGMGNAAKWISVRVNLHLARQIEYPVLLDEEYEDDD